MSRVRSSYSGMSMALMNCLITMQIVLGLRVITRLLRTRDGERILPDMMSYASREQVAIIVPVLNEYERLSPCLEGLMAQGTEVSEILVVDGESTDGTPGLVMDYMLRDPRIRLVDASPVPSDWNGKAWGLQVGLQAVRSEVTWVLTMDADVRPKSLLTRSLLERAQRDDLAALSVATLQELDSLGEGLLHPSLLTTLVYRFGIPGKVSRRVNDVQANGQCFLFRRAVLTSCEGFARTRFSTCEDVTIAHMLVHEGYRVGFFEAGDLVSVKMYNHWWEMWNNWTRSLPMHDHFSGFSTLLGWLEVVLVQALPLPLFFFLVASRCRSRWLLTLNSMLAILRIGVLFGTARTYRGRPWSYWLSPICDLPVALQLAKMALQRKHVWRGRVLIRKESL